MIPLAWGEIEALALGELRGPSGRRRRPAGARRLARRAGPATSSSRSTRACASSTTRSRPARRRSFRTTRRLRSRRSRGSCADARTRRSSRSSARPARRRRRTRSARSARAVTPTVAADASKNNELGLPLTVLRLEPETRVLVTEMGMRGLGQIAELCEVARPTVALVTSIGPEHLELVGTVEDVARANAEAIEALPTGGIAVVPADEPLLEPYLRDDLDVRRFDRERGRARRRRVAVPRRWARDPARAAVHAASSRGERGRGADRVRRARAFRWTAPPRARLGSA